LSVPLAALSTTIALGSKQTIESGLLWRCIMLGVLMTFLVPFILSIFGSTLIVDSEGNPANLLNYVAICLAVAIAPRFFLVKVSSSILSETRANSDKVDLLQYQLKQLQEELLPLIDTETEDNSLTDVAMANEADPHELETTSSKVLKTLGCGRFIYRSLPDLCRKADTDESTMNKASGFLTLKSLVGRIGVRWYITERGRKIVEVGA
jgi:hypothetical protein